jgi:hypothetical protein
MAESAILYLRYVVFGGPPYIHKISDRRRCTRSAWQSLNSRLKPFRDPIRVPFDSCFPENFMTEDPSDSADQVRQLNDAFRHSFTGGVVAVTAGAEALPRERGAALLARVRAFDAFNEDNDPHGEHDLGVVEDGDIGCPSLAASARLSSGAKCNPWRH